MQKSCCKLLGVGGRITVDIIIFIIECRSWKSKTPVIF